MRTYRAVREVSCISALDIWWANDRTAAFKDFQGCALNEFCERASSCTGTFLNKNWILTAAHCMVAAQMQSIEDNPPPSTGGAGGGWPPSTSPYCMQGGQLGDIHGCREGVSSWVVSWPSHVVGEESAQTLGMLGVTAYQFPHEHYDNCNTMTTTSWIVQLVT